MPYYKWSGIDKTGLIHYGSGFAPSKYDLKQILEKKEIELTHILQTRGHSTSKSRKKNIEFLKHLALLLDSGVSISQALTVLTKQTKSIDQKELIYDILFAIENGTTVADAFSKYPDIFNSPCIAITHAGQESGSLANALSHYCDYQETIENTKKKLRDASLIPIITFIIFLVITLCIAIFIIPHFEQIIRSHKLVVPQTTQLLFTISKAITIINTLYATVIFILILILFRLLMHITYIKNSLDKIICHIPLIKNIIKTSTLVTFLRTLSLLIQSGVDLQKALVIAKLTSQNSYIQTNINSVIDKINAGESLSNSFETTNHWLFDPELTTIIAIGQEASQLGPMLSKAANMYTQKLNQQLNLISSLFQPVLVIILGLLIAGLIIALYIPIFSLAELIQI